MFTFPIELWNMYQWTCDTMPRTDSVDFCNVPQSSVTNMHPSIWKLIPLSVMDEVLVNKKNNAK